MKLEQRNVAQKSRACQVLTPKTQNHRGPGMHKSWLAPRPIDQNHHAQGWLAPRHAQRDAGLPTDQFLSKCLENVSRQQLCKQVSQLLMGIDRLDGNSIIVILQVRLEPMNLAVVEL